MFIQNILDYIPKSLRVTVTTGIQDANTGALDFSSWVKRLSALLKLRLPGEEAQFLFAPATRKLIKTPPDAIPSSVLLLLYPYQEAVYTVVMQRPDYDGTHSGQISLPGGKYEPEDHSMLETALREAYEEIGISKQDVNVIGELSPLYIPPSNFIVYPFVAFCDSKPAFFADPTEVKEIIEFRLSLLFKKENQIMKEIDIRNSKKIEVPGFLIENHFIWGATAMIFSEMISVLNQ